MNLDSEAWISEVRAALSDVPDQDPAVQLSHWARHEQQPRSVLTLYGAYNTGKTTLLRRLLLADGRDVPEWLTVSARPQTFTLGQTDALGWTIRDTPGIAAGQPAHEATADEALLHSDAFLIVLGPQLMTGEREALLRLLSGRLFCKTGISLTPGTVFIVVNRMDEAVDPVDNQAGYEDMVARKRDALLEQLRRANINPDTIPIHFVIADYAGQFATTSSSDLREHAPAREPWDGMHELVERLRTSSVGTLRQAARSRFHLWLAQQTLDRAVGQLDIERKKLAQLRASTEERALAQQELNVLAEAARSELDGLIHTELLSLERGAYEEQSLEEQLRERLGKELQQWTERYDLRLRRLTERIGEAVGRAPDFDPEEWHRLAQAIEPSGVVRGEGWSLWLRRIRERWTGWHQAMVRMHAVEWLISAGFRTDTQRRRATSNLLGQSTFMRVSPWLIELTGLLMDGVQERQVAQERAQRRSELRQKVEAAARRMATLYLEGDRQAGIPGWLDGVTTLRQRLEQSLQDQEKTQKSLESSVARLEQCRNRLTALLNRPPIPRPMSEARRASARVVSLHDPKDEDLLQRLDTHLSSAKAAGIISHWDVRDIAPGAERTAGIDQQIDQAQLVLLCISADALASYSWRHAAQRALDRQARKETMVIPILFKPTLLDADPLGLGSLQLLPRTGQALSQCSDQEATYLEIAAAIRAAAEEIAGPSQ